MRLPRKPQYVLVRLDEDMVPEGPLRGGRWPRAKGLLSHYYEGVLTYHHFGKRPLRKGDRVCVNDGLYRNVFGTVIGRARRYSGYTYGVRRSRLKTITVDVPTEIEVEVA